MKTKVLFRFFHGEVLALFPAIAGTCHKPEHCQSYAHVGQHSAADVLHVMRASKPATRAQFAPLTGELRRIGYALDIRSRCTRADYLARVEQLKPSTLTI